MSSPPPQACAQSKKQQKLLPNCPFHAPSDPCSLAHLHAHSWVGWLPEYSPRPPCDAGHPPGLRPLQFQGQPQVSYRTLCAAFVSTTWFSHKHLLSLLEEVPWRLAAAHNARKEGGTAASLTGGACGSLPDMPPCIRLAWLPFCCLMLKGRAFFA